MQGKEKPPSFSGWLTRFPRLFIISGLLCAYLFSLVSFAPQVSAATQGTGVPGGTVSDQVVRQVDIARPAVVRIVTTIDGKLTVHFNPTSTVATFPQGGGTYPIELSGSGAFISAHGDILTADHVVNPPHDQSLDGVLYQIAAQDVADYVNTHLNPNPPFAAADALAELETGAFPATTSYGQTSSKVYLSTAYAGNISGTKLANVPASDSAVVDRIEAQSSFDARDVAIVHVSGMDDMPSIKLGNSSQVQEQDNLTLIGYPGLADISNSPTDLLTSSINKIYVSAIKVTDSGAPVIEVGGNVEHGDSGGPVLDANGDIVGIVSFGLANPNEIGETSFLQASNSAKTLIDSLSLNTAPGPFETAWSQAFGNYSSTDAGHWHKAASELQSLSNNYKNFLGITPYLAYAQNQASTEQLAPATTTGTNPLLIVLLVLLALIILGVVLFVLLRQRRRPALAGYGVAQPTYGAYPQQPGGVSGVYPPGPASYGAPNYAQPAPGMVPVNNSTSDAAQSAPGVMVVSYPPTPASYGAATWREQSASQVPQTPQPVISQPLRPLFPVQAESTTERALPPAVNTPLPSESDTTARAANPFEHTLPTWTPPVKTPETAPVEQPVVPASEVVPVAQSVAPASEAVPLVQQVEVAPEAAPIAQSVTPEVKPAQSVEQEQSVAPILISGSLSETWSKSAVYALPADQAEAMAAGSDSVAGSTLPSSADWPTITTPEDEKTVQAPSAGAARSFSVPRRPATPLANNAETLAATPSGVHTWTAPCGHVNTPDVRFCRVCGQPTGVANGQNGTDANTL